MSNYSINDAWVQMNDTQHLYNLDGQRSEGVDQIIKIEKPVSKKRGCYTRKSGWTSTTITSLIDDGHEWRKYGQKEILKAKHKRNYYRCTHKIDQGCQATKQVQMIQDDPPKYKITYIRHHSCKNFLRTSQIILDSPNSNDTSILLSFESNGLIEKEQVEQRHPPYKPKEPKHEFLSIDMNHNQSSSSCYNTPHYPILLNSTEPMSSMSRMEHENMISTPIYEYGHILDRTVDFSEIPYDHAHCELTGFNYF